MRATPIFWLVLAAPLATQDPVPEGHSHIGEAFNEGPRQAAYLMDGMNTEIAFPVSTRSKVAQNFVQQGLVQLHGFWYFESERSFRQAAAIDPDCAFAYCGMALSNIENEPRAHDFAAQAWDRRVGLPDRERRYVEAVARLFGAATEDAEIQKPKVTPVQASPASAALPPGHPPIVDPSTDGAPPKAQAVVIATADAPKVEEAPPEDAKTEEAKEESKPEAPAWQPPAPGSDADKKRRRRFVEDLEELIYHHPDDLEARALLANQLWLNTRAGIRIESKQANQGLLDPVFAKYPLHPAHHYRVHLWDHRDTAHRVLDSAAAIGHSAPGIAHMWHMGGHIYARLDRHADAAWQQEASARVDHAHMMRDLVMPDQIHNYAHNNEWLCRSLRHVGRVVDAIDLAKNMVELPRHPDWNVPAKRSSSNYGPRRLLEVLETFEAWDEAFALRDTMYLAPHGEALARAQLCRVLARAHFARGEREPLETLVREVESALSQARIERAEAVDEAEEVALSAEGRDVDSAMREAARSPTRDVRTIRKIRSELQALGRWLDGDREAAVEALAAGDHDQTHLSRLYSELGNHEKAIELAEAATEDKGRAQPLANLAYVLHVAGELERAKDTFEEMRAISARFDLDYPPFQRLARLAAQLGYERDWRIPFEQPGDVGNRPDPTTLGPFRWSPVAAPDWSLRTGSGAEVTLAGYRGQPTLVVFFLGYGCVHCVEQLQAIKPQIHAFQNLGIEVVAIGTDSIAELAQAEQNATADDAYPFPIAADPELAVFRQYRCVDDFENLPLHGTFLLDGKGRIRWQDIGYEPFMNLEFLLEEAERLLSLPVVGDD